MPKSHIHKYKRATLGMKKWKIYRCILPGCSHYIDATLIRNKISLCHRCNEPFIVENRLAELSEPHCFDCTEKRVTHSKGLLDFIEGMK